MRVAIILALALAPLTATPLHAQSAPPAAEASARQQVEQVIDRFQKGLIAKDKPALTALFLPQNGSWISVLSDSSYKLLAARRPGISRAKPGSAAEFIDFVASNPARIEEKFSNVRIETDGAVASVYFDFVFLIDGKENNRGAEAWQLVNTGDGWKISALVYSQTIDPALLK
jgi:hypothetical protein